MLLGASLVAVFIGFVLFGIGVVTGIDGNLSKTLAGAGIALLTTGIMAPAIHNANTTPEPIPAPAPTPIPQPLPTPQPAPQPAPYIPPVPQPVPSPIPVPAPQPAPVPPGPVTAFGQGLAATFTGTQAEGQTIAALFLQMSDIIIWDGQRATPKIQTTNDLGLEFAELQRYRGLSEIPWGAKFAPMKEYFAAGMVQRGIIGADVSFDQTKRAMTAQLYLEAGMGLANKQYPIGY